MGKGTCHSTLTTHSGEKVHCDAVSHPLVIAPHYGLDNEGRRWHWSDGIADSEPHDSEATS